MLYRLIGSVGSDQRFVSPTKLIAAEILAGVSSAASLSDLPAGTVQLIIIGLSKNKSCLPSAHASVQSGF